MLITCSWPLRSFRLKLKYMNMSVEGFKVVDDNGKINVEIIKSISELDNSVVSFNHGVVETIPPGECLFLNIHFDYLGDLIFYLYFTL